MQNENGIDVFSYKSAVAALREKGYTLTDSTIEVVKFEGEYRIASHKIDHPFGNRLEIYDRTQYSTGGPPVGMFIETYGMCYGDNSANYRVSCLDDILRKLEPGRYI